MGKFKLGDKVVPFKKTTGCSENESYVMQMLKEDVVQFLYLNRFDVDNYGKYVMVCSEEKGNTGDFFNESDLVLYSEPISNKKVKTEVKIETKASTKFIKIGDVTIALPMNTLIGYTIKHPDDEYDNEMAEALSYYRMRTQL